MEAKLLKFPWEICLTDEELTEYMCRTKFGSVKKYNNKILLNGLVEVLKQFRADLALQPKINFESIKHLLEVIKSDFRDTDLHPIFAEEIIGLLYTYHKSRLEYKDNTHEKINSFFNTSGHSPEKSVEVAKINMKLSANQKPIVLKCLKNYFDKDHLDSLEKLLDGDVISAKINFKGQPTIFINFWARVKNSAFISLEKNEINQWLCENFTCNNKIISPHTVKSYLNIGKKITKENLVAPEMYNAS